MRTTLAVVLVSVAAIAFFFGIIGVFGILPALSTLFLYVAIRLCPSPCVRNASMTALEARTCRPRKDPRAHRDFHFIFPRFVVERGRQRLRRHSPPDAIPTCNRVAQGSRASCPHIQEETLMNASTTAMTSSTGKYTSPAFWERLWRMSGINFVVFAIIAAVMYGDQGNSHPSPDRRGDCRHGHPQPPVVRGGNQDHAGGCGPGRLGRCRNRLQHRGGCVVSAVDSRHVPHDHSHRN